MTATPTPNWQHTAVGKFFDIASRAAGLRADLTAKMARRAEPGRASPGHAAPRFLQFLICCIYIK